jgi:hypothetical protein
MVDDGNDHAEDVVVKKEKEMSLIDRYVAEVGRHLPEKDRADIEAEIRSMIEDTLEERDHNAKSADDKVIVEMLEQFGDPKLLASQYAPPRRYLIGPEWYEVYVKVLQRVLYTAIPVYLAVMMVLALTQNPLDFGNAVEKAVGGAFDVGLQILFWVTLAFVFVERSGEQPEELRKPGSQPWTVAQLPELPGKRQISVAEALMNIATLLFVMIWIALPIFQGEGASVPFLHPNLWNFWLPAFFVLTGLSVVHEIFQLKIGYWTPALTVTNVILGILSIVYIAALITTQEVINPAFLAMLDSSLETARLREVAIWSVDISAAIIAGIYVWDILHSIRMARQLIKSNPEIPAVVQKRS